MGVRHRLGGTATAAKQVVDFKKEIWPLFQEHCVKCHGPDQQKSGYRIDIAELALEGGEMGEAIIPGNSAKSPLIHFISGLDEEIVMPPKGDPFNAKTVGLIRAWIDQGADWPEDFGAQGGGPDGSLGVQENYVAELAAVYASNRCLREGAAERKDWSSIRARTSAR